MSALGVDAPVRSRRSWAILNKIRATSAIKRAPMSFVSASEEGSAYRAPRTRIASPRPAAWKDSATRRSRPATRPVAGAFDLKARTGACPRKSGGNVSAIVETRNR
jgi:hypothetical protein